MASMTIELSDDGIQAFLKSNEMIAGLKPYADQIAKRAGDGYEVDQHIGRTRANLSVYPATKEAWSDLYKNNTLVKAMR